MTDVLKAAFMFIAPQADPETHQQWVKTPKVEVLTIGVSTYQQAAATARKLAEKGITAIELCGGFGAKGTALVAEAVEGKIPVGVVRFDIHPGLGNISGDQIF